MAEYRIDELAREADTTVRNVRAYQSRGLIPPPELKGRTGYYGDEHLARIELIRELQTEGFNLEAIRRLLEGAGGSDQEAELERARMQLYGAPVEVALQQTSAEVDLEFVPLLALHTRQGFYADPIYGGNHDRVGWDVIGFPGPSSLAEVHSGRYSTLAYFAKPPVHPGQED